MIISMATKPADHRRRSSTPRKPVRVAIPANSKIRVLQSIEGQGVTIEILEYARLDGCRDVKSARNIYYANEAGIRLKQVRIQLDGGAVHLEPGALHFMKGHIDVVSKAGGLLGLARGIATKLLAKEKIFRPRYSGQGEIHLEPTFGHFLIHYLNDETLIADKGLYYCSEETIRVSLSVQKNLSSSLFGGEGLFQTKVSGTGVCVFLCPVPADEVICYDLNDETLKVDGNFALMRSGDICFSVRPSAKNPIGMLTTGEGLLQTFKGTGRVWIAPTQAIYEQLSQPEPIEPLSKAQGSSGTETSDSY